MKEFWFAIGAAEGTLLEGEGEGEGESEDTPSSNEDPAVEVV